MQELWGIDFIFIYDQGFEMSGVEGLGGDHGC